MPLRTLAKNLVKLGLVGGLLYWMIHSGRLDPKELNIFRDSPEITLMSIGLWILGPTLLGSLRWWLLLEAAGYRISWLRTMLLHVVGFFFSSAMPGSVGGDVIKAFYIVKANPSLSKTYAMMTVVMDRILGMCGLFLMGFAVMLVTGFKLLEIPAVRAQFMVMTSVTAAMAVFLLTFMYPHRDGRDPFLRILNLEFPGAALLRKLYLAFRLFHRHKLTVFRCILISAVIQLMGFFLFVKISTLVTGFNDLAALSIFYPIGILTTALPLAPGGIGVGHMAFDRLFHLVGINGGANVFNVYVLGQLALNLLGFIPYLFLKRAAGSPIVENGIEPLTQNK